jgi:hypothetical protein
MEKNKIIIIIILIALFVNMFADEDKIRHVQVKDVVRMEVDKIVNDWLWLSAGVLTFGLEACYFALLTVTMEDGRNPWVFWSLFSLGIIPLVLESTLPAKYIAKSKYDMSVFGQDFSKKYDKDLKDQVTGRIATDVTLGCISGFFLYFFIFYFIII